MKALLSMFFKALAIFAIWLVGACLFLYSMSTTIDGYNIYNVTGAIIGFLLWLGSALNMNDERIRGRKDQ